jgi:hypothetical protein
MFSFLLQKFAGRHHRKYVEKCRPIVARINEHEQSYQALTDEQLRAKTDEFRARLKNGENPRPDPARGLRRGQERRPPPLRPQVMVCEHELTWDMVHFDVQLIGGIALHEGRIAEMATGEGKTLVATLPLYLNALTGRNTQLVTVNDYLARRDSEWMGHLYNFLGVTVGCIQQQMASDQRREMYGRDITYGTASEFGFDYLRDNGMATRKEDQVQRDHWYCIVDEIDSILVDEARTPLIISGPAPIEREQPFTALRPGGRPLVADQTRLCNRSWARPRSCWRKRTSRRRPPAGRAQAAPGEDGQPEEQAAPPPHGAARMAQAPRQDRDGDELRLPEGGALPPEGGAVLRHRRAPAPGRPHRDRPHQAPPGQSRRLRAARPRDRVLRARQVHRRHPEEREARKLASRTATPRSPRTSTPSPSSSAPIPSTSATSNTSCRKARS